MNVSQASRLTPARNLAVKSQLLEDGFVSLYNSQTSMAFTLPPLGGIVWELCDGTLSLDEIIQRVYELIEAAVSLEDLEAQVCPLIEELQGENFFQ